VFNSTSQLLDLSISHFSSSRRLTSEALDFSPLTPPLLDRLHQRLNRSHLPAQLLNPLDILDLRPLNRLNFRGGGRNCRFYVLLVTASWFHHRQHGDGVVG
jgi:hypothetical protein